MGYILSQESANSGLLKEFLLESFEGLSTITELLPKLEKSPQDEEIINSIYRAVHTLKGAACFLHFAKLQELTHAAENLLELIKKKKLMIVPDVIDTLLSFSDLVGLILSSIESTSSEGASNVEDVVKRINDIAIGKISGVDSSSTHAPEPAEREPVVNHEVSPAAQKEWGVQGQDDGMPEKFGEDGSIQAGSGDQSDTPDRKKSVSDSVVRVNVNLLDKMMNVVGELVLNRNQIIQFATKFDNPELNRLASQLNLITSELQTDIMTTRMQPIGAVLNKFERIVRDMARESGKRINIRIEGKETELDKTLLEAVKDPLTHLIRNAVDHGLETPDQREKSGKSKEGLLSIRAYHEGGQVTVEIQDDGRGLQREKILNKAIKNNLISAESARQMSEKQINDLIFLPGFSTAEKVTNLSGRGVGMDVVRTNIERIGGVVDVSSKEGHGTTFKLRVPLTLAIVPALLIGDDNEYFAIPQVSLVELVLLEGERLSELESIQGAEFFRLRGELVPIVRLRNILNGVRTHVNSEIPDQSLNILVLNADGRVFGLIVDAIEDTQEIVVKPLKLLKSLSIYAGATIMGDGRVALILDPTGIASWSQLAQSKEDVEVVTETQAQDYQELLLFRLLDRCVYGIPLCLINRLEEIKRDQIEYVGRRMVLRYRGHVMPLIDLNEKFHIGKTNLERDRVPLLVLYLNHHYFGLLVDEISDITSSEMEIQALVKEQEGIMGSLFVGERTVTVIDTFKIIDCCEADDSKSVIDKDLVVKAKNKVVLVVEDSPLFRKMSIDVLEGQGYGVLAAHDGEEALAMLNQEKVDLVLTDVEMPKLDGFGLAKSIKDDKRFEKLPMIALTSRYSESDRAMGKKLGFVDYLEKFKREEIVASVNRTLLKAS